MMQKIVLWAVIGLIFSSTAYAAESYGANWLWHNIDIFQRVDADQLSRSGFQYIPQHNMYSSSNIPDALKMTYQFQNGKVKIINVTLASYSSYDAANTRWNNFVHEFHNDISTKNTPLRWSTFTKDRIKVNIYDFKNFNFYFCIILYTIPYINRHGIYVRLFSKDFFDVQSVCNNIGM